MTTTALLTAATFALLPDDGRRRALVAGEVIETMPPGGKHGGIAARLVARLIAWIDAGAGGYAGVGSGFVLATDPDTVRAPDVAYVAAAHLPAGGPPEGFWQQAPDLAVEVVSPGETADEVRAKVHDYLAARAQLVWLVYPRTREVLAHTPDGHAQTFGPDATLIADLLPGFALPVVELFRQGKATGDR